MILKKNKIFSFQNNLMIINVLGLCNSVL